MTGGLLVVQLLSRGHDVRVVARRRQRLPAAALNDPKLTVVEASILELSDLELSALVKGCDAVVSCLGHVMNFKGIFAEPKKLCTDAVQRLCAAIEREAPESPAKFILMNTVGVPNPELAEKRTRFDRAFLTLLRHVLPPHRDNETAAEHLFHAIGQDNAHIEWCSVRPDSLINADVSPYEIVASPTTGVFSGAPTTRANVAHFMAELIEADALWEAWKFKAPVIMNVKA